MRYVSECVRSAEIPAKVSFYAVLFQKQTESQKKGVILELPQISWQENCSLLEGYFSLLCSAHGSVQFVGEKRSELRRKGEQHLLAPGRASLHGWSS